MKDSPKWRLVWLDLAPVSFANGEASGNWISQIKPLLTANSIDEQGDLAEVYVACAERQDYPQDFTAAADALKPFLQNPKMGAAQWLTYAGAAAGQHDFTTAQQAYRQALKLDPTNSIAQNNLADLLRQTGSPDSLKEAEDLISKAIARNGSDPEAFNFYDTLARVLLKEGRPADAIAAFEKGYALNPKSLDILIGLASACASNSQIDAAVRYLSQIDTLVPAGAHLSDELQAELTNARELVRKMTRAAPRPVLIFIPAVSDCHISVNVSIRPADGTSILSLNQICRLIFMPLAQGIIGMYWPYRG